MEFFSATLLLLLIFNAILVVCSRKLLTACLIFMAQSLITLVLWVLLQAPDLAVTEAAVGSGVSSLLFFLALKRIRETDAAAEDHPGAQESRSHGSRQHGKGGRQHA